MPASPTSGTVLFARTPGSLTISDELQDSIAATIAASHPHEAGGYLACTRRDDRLHATDHVPLENVAAEPRRRFVATPTDRVPSEPRVFYHSHTSPSTPSGLTGVDRRNIHDPLALVVFAPHGEPYSYRLFQLGLFGWREVPVTTVGEGEAESEKLPRLV
ncbi:Mov34/MPN/PAD-1 family protein [Haloarcula sp. GH36]|uniref:Mov34/MPN/PAD-1 family protein n=1 Tax=Haloarcula montana TaxID=3111776 RepID=UPI002D7801B9|nr:Mov34/MPN/PAD-1 family protein [Haloarcula sp. GH36]